MCWLDYKVVEVRLGRVGPTDYVRMVAQRKHCRMRHNDCGALGVRRGRLSTAQWNAMVGSGSVYCGEQDKGGDDNMEASQFPRGDAPLAARVCSRRAFCAGAFTGALALVASLDGCAARRDKAEGSAAPAEVAVAPDAQRVAASIIKLPILACALETVAAGELSLDEQITVTQRDIVGGSGSIQSRGAGVSYSVDELLRAMIAQSDNVAANLIIGRLGMDAVNETCTVLGLTQTALARLMMDTDAQARGLENYTSARDAATVLQRLAAGTIATPELCERARGYLLAQEDMRGIVEGVTGDASVAHKTGSLANAQHDAAIVYAERPYVLTVLTQDLEREQALALERDISSAIYAHAHS